MRPMKTQQLPLFEAPVPFERRPTAPARVLAADDELSARLGRRVLEQMARARTRPEPVRGVRCTACGRGNFAGAGACRSCGAELGADAPPASREQLRALRNLRDRPVRATTINERRMRRDVRLEAALDHALVDDDGEPAPTLTRPTTRAECAGVPRPCPFVSCAHHLYLDVSSRTGAIKLNFPEIEPGEMHPDESCELDIAEQGGTTLEDVGRVMNLTRERIRQIETRALAQLGARDELAALREFYGVPREGAREASRTRETKRRLPMLREEHEQNRERHEPDAGKPFDAAEFAGAELDDV